MSAVSQRAVTAAIVVSALGYFVDVYDLLLFSIVRVSSLTELGVQGDDILTQGVFLLNVQMMGMLIGGVLWGVLGDKKGRLSVLFGSIFLYSAANLANAFVHTVEWYAVCRLIAGLGLAGELGAGITLVSESLPKDKRGLGTTIVASVGVAGAIAAAIISEYFSWRTCYIIGGVLGFCLLLLRIGVYESGMFEGMCRQDVKRGDFLGLFKKASTVRKYLSCIFVGFTVWYVVGILITFTPEFGKAFGMPELPKAGKAVMWCYVGLVVGDICSGLLSQYLRKRKQTIKIFLICSLASVALFLTQNQSSLERYYFISFLLGLFVGYWAVFVTTASEQFGTNLRATVTTSVPNFVRGAVVPLTWLFQSLKINVDIITAAGIVGCIAYAISFISLFGLQESFERDLDFVE